MALELDFNICQTNGCSSISPTDATGPYHSVNNLTGFGSPNITISDTGFEAIITIEDADGAITEVDVTSEITTNGGYTVFEPIAVDIPDGSFTVTYTVSTDAASATITKKFFSYCTVRCCVFKKMRDAVAKANCNCEKDLNYELFLWAIYKAMIFAASGCNYDEAEELLAQLEIVCDTDDCGCN
jgi:hypothetical protein